MLIARMSSLAVAGSGTGVGVNVRRLNQPGLLLLLPVVVLTALCAVSRRRIRGRSVKVGLYSMTNSVSSLAGEEAGMPSLIGADSPLNIFPNKGLADVDCLSGVVLALVTNVAKDFARECSTDRDRVNAAAAAG